MSKKNKEVAMAIAADRRNDAFSFENIGFEKAVKKDGRKMYKKLKKMSRNGNFHDLLRDLLFSYSGEFLESREIAAFNAFLITVAGDSVDDYFSRVISTEISEFVIVSNNFSWNHDFTYKNKWLLYNTMAFYIEIDFLHTSKKEFCNGVRYNYLYENTKELCDLYEYVFGKSLSNMFEEYADQEEQ